MKNTKNIYNRVFCFFQLFPLFPWRMLWVYTVVVLILAAIEIPKDGELI